MGVFAPYVGVMVRAVCCASAGASTAYASFNDLAIGPVGVLGGLNDSGQVTGTRPSSSNSFEAFRWSAGTLVTPGVRSEGLSINNSGVVAGDLALTLPDGNPVRQAYYWAPGSNPVVIGALPGDTYSSANAINASGQIAGNSSYAAGVGPGNAFRWSPGSGFVDLGHLGTDMFGTAISSIGHVAGTYANGPQNAAFIYTDSQGAQPIPTLGVQKAIATAINDHDQVVGNAQTPAGNTVAYVWSAADGIAAIDSLGGSFAIASSINNAGQVVGYSYLPGDPTAPPPIGPTLHLTHAFYWDWQFGTIDLNPPGWLYSTAVGINSSGQILGVGLDGSLHGHEFLITLPPQILGDANHDGVVAFDDLLTLAQHYGQSGTYAEGDFDRNGVVNFNDLLILAQHYGQHIEPSAAGAIDTTPEPGALGMCGLLLLLARQGDRGRQRHIHRLRLFGDGS